MYPEAFHAGLMGGELKPYDAEVQWIETQNDNSLTTYFDTGVKWARNKIICKFRVRDIFAYSLGDFYPSIFITDGISGDGGKIGVQLRSNWVKGNAYNCVVDPPTFNTTSAFGDDFTVETNFANDNQLRFTNIANILIFGRSDCNWEFKTSVMPSIFRSGRIYWFKIIDENNVSLRDYIPVRKNGIACFYDKLTGELLTNKGTSTPVFGPDV